MKNKKYKLKIKKKTLALIDWANVYGWKKKLKWEVCPEKLFSFLSRFPKIIDKRFYFGEDRIREKSKNFKLRIEEIGFTPIFKEVKWVPVYLEEQNHFKKIVKELFDELGKISETNFNISDRLKRFEENMWYPIEPESYGTVHDVNELVKNLNNDLSESNRKIIELQKSLKKPCLRCKCDFDVEITRDAFDLINEYETLLLFSGDGDYSVLVNDLIEKNKKVILVFGSGCKGKEYNEIKSNLFYTCSVDKLRKELEKIDSEKIS